MLLRARGPVGGRLPKRLEEARFGERAGALAEAGLLQALWQPAPYGATGPQQHPRDNEWLGLWHKPPSP